MHGSIGGCWGGDDHGEPEYAPGRETGGTEPGRPTAARQTSGLPHRSHKTGGADHVTCDFIAHPLKSGLGVRTREPARRERCAR
jgi:hypothetical protein